LLIENYSAFAGRAAATKGSDLGGLGGYPSTSVLAGLLPAKIANMYIFALLATTSMTLQRHGEAVLL